MRNETRLQNFLLPMIAGAVVALPVLLLTRPPAGATLNATTAAAEPEPVCGPFVESFMTMRAEADRMASLAASTALPPEAAEAGGIDMSVNAAAWTEIAAAARSLDTWLWEANHPNAPLDFREETIVAGVTPIASELKWDAEDIANQLAGPMAEEDYERLARRMEALARAAAGIARALDPLTVCKGPVLSYGPHNDCETRDPEYQASMSGACLY